MSEPNDPLWMEDLFKDLWEIEKKYFERPVPIGANVYVYCFLSEVASVLARSKNSDEKYKDVCHDFKLIFDRWKKEYESKRT